MSDQRHAAREEVLTQTAAWLRRQDWSELEEPEAESLADELESRAGYNVEARTVIDVPVDGDGFPQDWPKKLSAGGLCPGCERPHHACLCGGK